MQKTGKATNITCNEFFSCKSNYKYYRLKNYGCKTIMCTEKNSEKPNTQRGN